MLRILARRWYADPHGTANFLPKAETFSMHRSENSCGSRGTIVRSFLTESGLRPSAECVRSGMVPDAQACGLEAVGDSTGTFAPARS